MTGTGGTFGVEIGPIEDLVEPIVAHRWWHVSPDGEALTSGHVAGFARWPTRANGGLVAECWGTPPGPAARGAIVGRNLQGPLADEADNVPHQDRDWLVMGERPPGAVSHTGWGCGIYGMRTVDDLAKQAWGTVAGRVLLGGRVREHTQGWRAQFAAVDALYLPAAQVSGIARRDTVQRLADRYGVETVELPDLICVPPSLGWPFGPHTAAPVAVQAAPPANRTLPEQAADIAAAGIAYLLRRLGPRRPTP